LAGACTNKVNYGLKYELKINKWISSLLQWTEYHEYFPQIPLSDQLLIMCSTVVTGWYTSGF
jgi:hypothetical protein